MAVWKYETCEPKLWRALMLIQYVTFVQLCKWNNTNKHRDKVNKALYSAF